MNSKGSAKVIGVVVIAAILIGGYLLLRRGANTGENGTNAPTNNDSGPGVIETDIVTYLNEGFSPAKIKVKVGTTVAFINQSSRTMWVASNPHPVHTNFPAFDSRESINPGGSYSFTFSEAGEFGYHNHDNASDLGIVFVE